MPYSTPANKKCWRRRLARTYGPTFRKVTTPHPLGTLAPSAPPRTAMSRFPIIDSPCPLRIANLPQAGRDHCGHCDRQVHNLDGMSNAQRETFMRGCNGKVCVAYTVHRQVARRNLSLGIGLVATLAGSAAMADELVVDTASSAPGSPVTDSTANPQ